MKIVCFVLLLGLLGPAVLLSCGRASESSQSVATKAAPASEATVAAKVGWEQQWDRLLTEAKKEGPVLVYFAPSPTTQRELTEAFNKRYGLDLEFVVGRGAVLAEKIFSERRAGLYLGDTIIQGDTVHLLTFKPQGVLQVLEPLLVLPEVKDPRAWREGRLPFTDEDHTAISFMAGALHYVVRNTEQVKQSEITSFNDLLQPRWKGQIVMGDPLISGAAQAWVNFMLEKILGVEKGSEYMRQFIKQEPVITRDDRLNVEGLARGKYKLSIGALPAIVAEFQEKGAPIERVRMKEGVKTTPGMGAMSVLTRNAHPNATMVFLNWLLTREAQTIFSKGINTPSARLDVPTAGLDPYAVPQAGEKVFRDSEADILVRDKVVVPIVKDIFGPLMK